MFTFLCDKFTQDSIYQILSESVVEDMTKNILVFFQFTSVYTLCLKKVPTFKLSVTLPNLN